MPSIRDILNLGPVMPVIVIDDSANALPLARALLEGGITTIEITLRTPAALDSIRAVADPCPDITVGAGTVTRADLAAAARTRAPLSPSRREPRRPSSRDAPPPACRFFRRVERVGDDGASRSGI